MRIGYRRFLSHTLVIIFFCFGLLACPPAAKKPSVKKPPRPGQEEIREKSREVVRPAAPATVATPQRKASERLVEKGIAELGAKNAEHAAQIFQDAVNVDASNGVAYYYLAMADAQIGRSDVAAGLLDKAESLLRYDSDWISKIEELRTSITGEKPSSTPLPHIIDEY